MLADEYTLLRLTITVFLGIMLFDLWLKVRNHMTLSSAYDRLTLSHPWVTISITAAIALLVLHLNTTLFF